MALIPLSNSIGCVELAGGAVVVQEQVGTLGWRSPAHRPETLGVGHDADGWQRGRDTRLLHGRFGVHPHDLPALRHGHPERVSRAGDARRSAPDKGLVTVPEAPSSCRAESRGAGDG